MLWKIVLAGLAGVVMIVLAGSGSKDASAQQPFDKFKKGGFFKKADPKEPEAPKVTDTAKPLTAEETAFFEKKIRPVLVDKCYSCHTEETPKGPKGSLLLNTKAGMLKGGDNGPIIVPGSPAKSMLIKALKGTDSVSQMPPKEKLPADVIADFEKWITMGAPDPRAGKATSTTRVIDIAKGKEHWAFQPVKTATAPKTSIWASSTIDQFVEAKLAEQKLTPVKDADKRTLARRAYFDLIGLPPTPEQIEAFVKDETPEAFAKLIDKLLESPQFGEKWGRHWLDIARYAESSGKEQNQVYPFAWRYRDYVIKSFNSDKPYDQFLREQLAGDLLTSKNDTDKAEKLIATGFLAIGAKSHAERSRQQFNLDLADEQIDVMGQAMLGLTIACARCHDHKFDPIPTKDYYAIAGIFTSTDTQFGTATGIQARQSASLVTLPKGADVPLGPSLTKDEVTKLKERVTEMKTQRDKLLEEARKNMTQPLQALGLIQQIGIAEKQLSYYDSEGEMKKMAMGVSDRSFPRDMPIHIRGELNKTGETVSRGVLQVIPGKSFSISRGSSGRKELAEWVASKDNPLTARVMANRVWQHLMGVGLVSTPDNFGTMGMKPSHPELLDYLADSFTSKGWSVKKLIREVMLSHTYRLASDYSEANAATDPDNVYRWRMSKRRLDAEAIRDSMLALSGDLNLTPPVASPIQKYEGNANQINRPFFGPGMGMGGPGLRPGGGGGINAMAEVPNRSVYIPIIRDNVPQSLELFDFAEPSLVSGSRDDTSVPSQGLFLLNNPTVIKQAEKFADKIIAKTLSETERIDLAFRMAFGRPASDTESKAAENFIKKYKEVEGKTRKFGVEKAAWSAFTQALFAAGEFRYLD